MSAASDPALDAANSKQRRASDPALSVFVAANAGAGKTKVLTERVARLLLNGVSPSRIHCITYTKAAAAEMADRLFKLLGRWALAEDATLSAELIELEGAARIHDFAKARRLFARALDAPGGLKIETIHAFCESVLKRFPLEARVSPGFPFSTKRRRSPAMVRRMVELNESTACSMRCATARASSGLLSSMSKIGRAHV